MAERTGFLLTRHWREGERGLELVFWIGTDEGPVRATVTEQESVCFIAESDLHSAQRALADLSGWRHAGVKLETFTFAPVTALYFRSQRTMLDARDHLARRAVEPSESDVRPTDRYLMERFITGALCIEGECEEHRSFAGFTNARMTPAEYRPTLHAVSIDIETSISHGNILSIALLDEKSERVWMVGEGNAAAPRVEFVADEAALIRALLAEIERLDPDLLLGWNVVNFDLQVLHERAAAHRIPFRIGRGGAEIEWRGGGQRNRRFARIPGRVAMDGIELLRAANYTFESFSLEQVSQELLGRGKLLLDDDQKAEQIETLYRQDQATLAEYNLEDCRLVWEIFEQERLVNFAVERAQLTGLELDRQGGSVAAFDYLYLPRLHRKGYVAPARPDMGAGTGTPGGYVLESTPGIFEDVIVLDFKSLYPSIIRTFHVDPLAMVAAERRGDPAARDAIPGFEGAHFSRSEYLLPAIIEELWQARDRAKQEDDSVLSYAIKIIMNSFYGVLGSPGCRFFDPRLVSSITRRGHEIIRQTRDRIEEQGYPVIYGDTDSVFVWINKREGELSVAETGARIVARLNDWWRDEIAREYDLESFLELQYETHYRKFLMPTVRGSERGSKKRYAGMVETVGAHGEPVFELVFKGLEAVRSDWTRLAREFQAGLYRRIFLEEPFEEYIRETVAQVVAGARDDDLVLRKRLRRTLDDYRSNVPPHVQAARKADRIRAERGLAARYASGGWIDYVTTVNGPEPLQYRSSPIDYQFYIDRQLAPIADAILVFKQTTMADIIDRQIGLF